MGSKNGGGWSAAPERTSYIGYHVWLGRACLYFSVAWSESVANCTIPGILKKNLAKKMLLLNIPGIVNIKKNYFNMVNLLVKLLEIQCQVLKDCMQFNTIKYKMLQFARTRRRPGRPNIRHIILLLLLLLHHHHSPMSQRVKIVAPVAIGLFLGYLYKGSRGELKSNADYDFKKEAKGSLNQAFGMKKDLD